MVKDHSTKTWTINSTKGLKLVVDSQKTYLLTIKLVNTFEIDDLDIDLADKKV